MSVLATDAIVLHAFDYLESSRIVRLVTREAGVRSAIARGARRSRRRFGMGIDLFAQGRAELGTKSGRDLDVLDAFEVQQSRSVLAGDLGRFGAAAMLAELTLRFASDDADSALFDAVAEALDLIVAAPRNETRANAIAGGWRILSALGFAPSLDQCTECAAAIPDDVGILFSAVDGGALCDACRERGHTGRKLPWEERRTLRRWMEGDAVSVDGGHARAHQRLLKEFVHARLSDGRRLPAYEMWEHTFGRDESGEGRGVQGEASVS